MKKLLVLPLLLMGCNKITIDEVTVGKLVSVSYEEVHNDGLSYSISNEGGIPIDRTLGMGYSNRSDYNKMKVFLNKKVQVDVLCKLFDPCVINIKEIK